MTSEGKRHTYQHIGEGKATRLKHGAGCLELDVNTFRGDLQLTTLGNLYFLHRLVTGGSWGVLDCLDELVTLKDLAENNVSTVEPPERG